MEIEKPLPIEFCEVAGTYGSVLEAVLPGDMGVLQVSDRDLLAIGVKLLARRAHAEIPVANGSKLVVYEKRGPGGCWHSGAALLLDLGRSPGLALTSQSARQLAGVLLAYSAIDNGRCDWLVRLESCQQDSTLATYQALQAAQTESR